jgi:hypothetical protein
MYLLAWRITGNSLYVYMTIMKSEFALNFVFHVLCVTDQLGVRTQLSFFVLCLTVMNRYSSIRFLVLYVKNGC